MAVYTSEYFFVAAFGLILISILIDGASIATVEWRVNVKLGFYRGLWKECIESKNGEQCKNVDRNVVENAAISSLILAMIFKGCICISLIFFRRYKRSRLALTIAMFVTGLWNIIAVAVYGTKYPTPSTTGDPTEFGLAFRLAIGNVVLTFVLCPIIWLILSPDKNNQVGYLTDEDRNTNQQNVDMEVFDSAFVRNTYQY